MSKVALQKVGVLFGGLSSEREISLQSGKAVIDALKNMKMQVVAIDMDKNFLQQLESIDVDIFFIALHGGEGEDGTVQAILDFADIPYTGSGMLASSLAFNKLYCKQLWVAGNLPTPDYLQLSTDVSWQQIVSRLGDKVIIKPASGGSSIGMGIANNNDDYLKVFEEAMRYDDVVFAEQWIEGEEYTVTIVNEKTLPIIRLKTNNAFYDYDAKYQSDETQYICPCGLTDEEEKEMQSLALLAFRTLGCEGWGRVDLMRDERKNSFLLEVNTVPGLTSHSLVTMAAAESGVNFEKLIMNILEV